MGNSKFVKIMLTLIFLVLLADLAYRVGIIEPLQPGKTLYLPLELTGTRIHSWIFNKHYHKAPVTVCNCKDSGAGKGSSVKTGVTQQEVSTGPAIVEGGGASEEGTIENEALPVY